MPPTPIPVTTGFTWTTFGVWVLNVLVGGVIVGLIRAWPNLKKLANDREANLLSERAAEMETMRKRVEALEAKLEDERVKHEAERALDRHRLNNLDQCLDHLFLIFETSPEKAAAAIDAVKKMRARQMEAEALEKATIHAAQISKTKGPKE